MRFKRRSPKFEKTSWRLIKININIITNTRINWKITQKYWVYTINLAKKQFDYSIKNCRKTIKFGVIKRINFEFAIKKTRNKTQRRNTNLKIWTITGTIKRYRKRQKRSIKIDTNPEGENWRVPRQSKIG